MTALGSGYDVVFELSGQKLRDAVLTLTRTTRELSCITREQLDAVLDGIPGLDASVRASADRVLDALAFREGAAWFESVALRGTDAGPAVRPSASFGFFDGSGTAQSITTGLLEQQLGQELAIPISFFLPPDAVLPFAGRVLPGVAARAARYKYVELLHRPALAIGFDLDIGDPENQNAWAHFDANFLLEDDWGIAVGRSVLQSIIDQRILDLMRGLNATETPIIRTVYYPSRGAVDETIGYAPRARPFVLSSLTARWGAPIEIYGRGQYEACGGLDFSFYAEASFEVRGSSLFLVIRVRDFDLDYWDAARGVICMLYDRASILGGLLGVIASIFGGAEAAAAPYLPTLDEINDKLGGPMNLGEVRFELLGGVLRAVSAQQTTEGLILRGRVDLDVPGRPHLVLEPGRVTFHETPESFCADREPPTFTSRPPWIRLANDGAGPLWICSAELSDGAPFELVRAAPFGQVAAQIARDGQSIAGLPEARYPTAPALYLGARPTGAGGRGKLRVLTNDPTCFACEVDLRLLAGGTPDFVVRPQRLELHYANSEDGIPKSRLVRCDIVPAPAVPPRNTFEIFNTGDGLLYLCSIQVQDPDGVFRVELGAGVVYPGESISVAVDFYPREVGRTYTALVLIESNAGPIGVVLDGRVDALPEERKGPFGLSDELIDHIADLLGEAFCLGPAADVCKVRGGFEPLPDPGARSVTIIDLEPVPRDAEVLIGPRDGDPDLRDVARAARRELTVHEPPPGVPGPDPCVIRFGGIDAGALDLVRVHVASMSLSPFELTGVDGARAIAARGGWTYVATQHGIQVVDWRDPAQPLLQDRLDLRADHLALFRDRLVAAGEGTLAIYDVSNPGCPVLCASTASGGPIAALGLHEAMAIASDGDAIRTFEMSSTHVRLTHAQRVPGDARSFGVFREGVYVLGEGRLTWLRLQAGGRLALVDSVEVPDAVDLSHFGRQILVSGKHGTRAFVVDVEAGLREVTWYRHRHWSVDLVPDSAHQRLFEMVRGKGVRLWLPGVRRIERSRYQDLLTLRYRPLRSRRPSRA